MPAIPPAGFSPASAFNIDRQFQSLPPVPILADLIDPKTGEYLSLEDSASIADGMVVTLMRTERDSGAAVLGFGQRFKSLRHVTNDSPTLAESLAREALKPATDAGAVGFGQLSASVNAGDGTQVDTEIEYLDLLAPTADQSRSIPFAP